MNKRILLPDFSGVEFAVASMIAKRKSFSEVYGIRKEEVLKLFDEDERRRMIIRFLTNFPKAVFIGGLRKVKARSMVKAMQDGVCVDGNHRIEYVLYTFRFSYRGTLIYTWDAYNDIEKSIHAGQYEHTASTKNQRKEIQKAIANFKEAILKL